MTTKPYGKKISRPAVAGVRLPNMKEETLLSRGFVRVFLLAAVTARAVVCPVAAADLNDYPTVARADYVFGCMKSNGESRLVLEQCACSIDVIASILSYDDYVAAETVASVNQQAGPAGMLMRNTGAARDALAELRRAQAEAQVRCF